MEIGPTRRAIGVLQRSLDAEERTSLRVLIAARWLVVGGVLALLITLAGRSAAQTAGVALILAVAAAANTLLAQRLRHGTAIPLALPILVSLYDTVGITVAVALLDGFTNPNFIWYFPAFLGILFVFPGRWTTGYCLAVMASYAAVVTTHSGFDWSANSDVRALVVRELGLLTVVLIANLVVQVERNRRRIAVQAERAAAIERQRITEDVHDSIAQELYVLSMELDSIAASQPSAPRLATASNLAKQTLLEARGLLTDLQPAFAGTMELGDLIRGQCDEFAAVSGIPTNYTIEGAVPRLAPEQIAEIYRILQEGLANIYRHAHAQSVTLCVHTEPDELRLELGDDGVGFERDADAGGHGLTHMQSRAARLGGSLTVWSVPGGGTTLHVAIPLEPGGREE